MHPDRILILDFGSQYTQLIARRVRELHVYAEIHPYSYSLEEIRSFAPQGIILSGGPASVFAEGAPRVDQKLFSLGIPILGVCYGMQLIAHLKGGEVERSMRREYGSALLTPRNEHPFFEGVSASPLKVWMSHGDIVKRLPPGFHSIAESDNAPHAAMASEDGKIIALQFHPEVTHTPEGKAMLANFLFRICKVQPSWTPASFVASQIEAIRNRVKKTHVLCALSGGVDSSVAAVLLHQAIGKQLTCIFVDHGLLRKGEAEQVERVFRENFRVDLRVVDAAKRFLEKLRGIVDPEEKRKIIGREFIAVFEEEAKRIPHVEFLAQGTLYPDVIESVSLKGPSATIKTHHNVGGLPEKMGLKLIEPFRELFKDEVREVGKKLGLPQEIIGRHPFPGPGLALRVIGEVTEERLSLLREADAIFIEELKTSGWYDKTWQAFAVLLPVKTVGVMGDERTYENVCALRAVDSLDGMTADWTKLPHDLLGRTANRIINEVKGINRVVYDISSKPPATIEWE